MACTRVTQFEKIVSSVAVTPNGQLLAAGLWKGGVQLLDARSGERRTRLWSTYSADSVAFSPANVSQPLLLAAGLNDDTVRVWDCSSVDIVAELGHKYLVACVAFSPDGRLLASASGDKTVRLWRTDDWHAPPAVLEGHTRGVNSVSFSCDGRLLASGSDDRTVRLWHILDKGATAAAAGPALEVGKPVFCVAFSPVDSRLLAFGGYGAILALARVGADGGAIAVERKLQDHTKDLRSLAFSPCGRKLASASDDFTVRLWSVASGACLRVLRGHTDNVRCVAFFPNGEQLASSGSWDETVRIWTVCAWSDKTHRHFGAPLKAAVFTLMCVRARLEQQQEQLPRLPMEVWLLVFGQLQLALGEDGVSKTKIDS